MMKTLVICLSALFAVNAVAAPPKVKRERAKASATEKFGERAATKEEQILDHLDTHKWKADPEATDVRPENLGTYHNRTYQRIVRLLHHGAISEENGLAFKQMHTDITVQGRLLRADGPLSDEEESELRGDLDALNDLINANLEETEKAANRTPILNQMQHRFQEQIEFGVRSGRLSTGEASRLKRKVESLGKLEDRLKDASGLSTRERERLLEEAAELKREISKDLND